MNNTYKFKSKVWLYPGKAAWHFVTLPIKIAKDIDYFFFLEKKGWGSLPVKVTVGQTEWKTSIFPDKKNNSYILPLKKEVRLNENINVEDNVSIIIKVGN